MLFTLLQPFFLRAEAPWSAVEKEPVQNLANCQNSYHAKFKISDPVNTQVSLLVLDPKEVQFELIDQPERSLATTVGELAQKHQAIAGINGGYFTIDFEPLGLFKTPKSQLGKVEKIALVGGFFVLQKGNPSLIWRKDFKDPSVYEMILQTGPRLVSEGKSIAGLEAKKNRPRTFVAQTQQGLWILGNCQKISLAALSKMLSTPNLFGDLTIQRALNFDGGRSAALWWKDPQQQSHSIEEVVIVRNALLVKPKDS